MSNPFPSSPTPQEPSQDALIAAAHDHFRAGRHSQAIALTEKLLQAQPRNPLLWNLAAAIARAIGQRSNAETFWKNALDLDPGYAGAHYNYGILLMEDKRFREAEQQFRQVPQNVPQRVQLLNNLGVTLEGQERVEEALQCYEQALAIDPAHAKAHHNRGLSLVALGRFEEGQQALETALQLAGDRDKAPFYRALTTTKRFTRAEDPHLQEMEALAARMETLSPGDQMQLNFALGKAYSDLKEHDRSLQCFLAANAEKRRQTPYDEAATLALLDQIRESFTTDLLERHQGSGSASSTPVFILGMPRSGSSLVEQILASHPDVHGAGELEDFKELAEDLLFRQTSLPLPQRVASLAPDALRQLGERYVTSLRKRAPEARIITDKRPLNFLYIGLIRMALPNARIIHTRRDPVETCLSCFSHLFNGHYPFTYDLAELGRYWSAYDRLMDHWRTLLPPDRLIEVEHEELVADPESGIRRLLQACDLPWNDACLAFDRTSRPVRTASALQVRQKIFHKSDHPWRRNESALQPLLAALQHSGNN